MNTQLQVHSTMIFFARILILFISILFLCNRVDAQTAIVRDADGFCNVRDSASGSSRIIDTLGTGRLVYVLEDQADGDWLSVDYRKGVKTRTGFINRSRLRWLGSLPKFKTLHADIDLLKLQLDTLGFVFARRPFTVSGRKVAYENGDGGKLVKSIDGRHAWGTDGGLPRYEYASVQMIWGRQTIDLPFHLYKDLFEPNFQMTTAYLDRSAGLIYVEGENGDSAGSYVVVWTISAGRVVNREVFIPF
jgi:hypothetical protein